MSEYYFEEGEWLDLRHAVNTKNFVWIESLLRDVENRHYRMRLAQEDMRIKAWFNTE